MLGEKHSDETKKLISLSQTGDKHHNFGKITPDEVKKKISISNSGENNGNFKYNFISKEFLIENYINKNKTITEIANEYGCSVYPISSGLKSFNIIKPGKSLRKLSI